MIRSRRPATAGRADGVHFGVLGMGVGTISAFAQRGDRVRSYEINPEVIELSRGLEPSFTFIEDSPATTDIVKGDARLLLERELVERTSTEVRPAGHRCLRGRLGAGAFDDARGLSRLREAPDERRVHHRRQHHQPLRQYRAGDRGEFAGDRIPRRAHGHLGESAGRHSHRHQINCPESDSCSTNPQFRRSQRRRLRKRRILFTDKYSDLLRVLY